MTHLEELELERLYRLRRTGDLLRERRLGGDLRRGGDLLSLYLGGEGLHLPGGPLRRPGGGLRRAGLGAGRGGNTVCAVTSWPSI